MGMPELLIQIKAAATTAISRSGRGVVALVLKDDTSQTDTFVYAKMTSVAKSHWTTANLDYIQKTFDGSPARVIVERISATNGDLTEALARLKTKKWNYIAVPVATSDEITELATWIKNNRASGKTFKAVLPNTAADNEGIVNFATDDILVGKKTYSTEEYCCRIAGILAGTDLDNSATYTVLSEVSGITESTDPDTDVEDGKLILINDGEHIKLGRAVNSLKTIGTNKTADMKKIKIMDGLDLMCDDIRKSFEENYIGEGNSYDNKLLFVNAVNVYLSGLERDGILYDEFDNTAYIDIDSQRAYLEGIDPSYAEYSDDDIKKANTGSRVYVGCNVKMQDAIEDLHFTIYI